MTLLILLSVGKTIAIIFGILLVILVLSAPTSNMYRKDFTVVVKDSPDKVKDDSKEIEMKDRIKALETELLGQERKLIELEKEIRQLKEKDNIKS